MGQTIEYRSIGPEALRADVEAGGFSGHAATFRTVDSYGTAFAPGAFRKTLRERGATIPVLYQHNPDWQIGVPDGLREDERGLATDVRLFEDGGTTVGTGSVALAQLRQGARFGMSFGFNTIADRAAKTSDGLDLSQTPDLQPADVRVITEVRLWEVSLVTFPANEQAQLTAVRAVEEAATLAGLIEAIRAGLLTDEQTALMGELLAAWRMQEAAGPDSGDAAPPTAEAPATRRAYATELTWLAALAAA